MSSQPFPTAITCKAGPVRRGGWILKLYEHSLSLALFLFFLISISVHALSGAAVYNDDQAAHGSSERLTVLQYAGTSRDAPHSQTGQD